MPERGLAIVGLGKRDAAFDAGLPAPVWHFRPGAHQQPTAAPVDWITTKLMDQHLYPAVYQRRASLWATGRSGLEEVNGADERT